MAGTEEVWPMREAWPMASGCEHVELQREDVTKKALGGKDRRRQKGNLCRGQSLVWGP